MNFKLILGITYLVILVTGLYFLFSIVDINELTSYEFVKSNKDIFLAPAYPMPDLIPPTC